jgi:hypothetical protein
LWWVFFQDRVSTTICLGWLPTTILLISISWVARIIGVSHWCLAKALCDLSEFLSHCRDIILTLWKTLSSIREQNIWLCGACTLPTAANLYIESTLCLAFAKHFPCIHSFNLHNMSLHHYPCLQMQIPMHIEVCISHVLPPNTMAEWYHRELLFFWILG